MSVLIKGMDMPQGCYNCPLQHRGFNGSETVHYCYVVEKEVSDDGETDTDCPLIEVPTPHGDLIDREELLNDAGGVYTARPEEAQKIQHEINKVLFAIQDAPTVIEAEGV